MNPRYKQLSCVILAAGLSRRAGKVNKLLALIDEKPMVRNVAEAVLDVGFGRVVVVLGHEAGLVKAALSGLELTFVVNEAFEDGMGASLAAGAAVVNQDLLVCLADLPWLKSKNITAVCDAFLENNCELVVIPKFEGTRGHPVAFPKRMLPELRKLQGDQGAKSLINQEKTASIEMPDNGCIRDLDNP